MTLARSVADALLSGGPSADTPPIAVARVPPPSGDALQEMVREARAVLFPGQFSNGGGVRNTSAREMEESLARLKEMLEEQIVRAFLFEDFARGGPGAGTDFKERASAIAGEFVSRLPEVQRVLATDVKAHYEGDPAAVSTHETVLCYPGVLAISSYRIAHELHRLGVPFIPRMITEQAHSATGIDIHPGASIGKGLFIDHGTGIVVGETCIIGDNVRIYQGVTLGAKSFPLDENGMPVKGIDRHPIIEDNVIIYSGSTLLGRITIGEGSVIGGNVWLTHGVPPKSRITQTVARMERFDGGGGV